MALRISLVFLLFSFEMLSQPEDLYFERYGMTEGLSSNQTLCFLKDSQGFIWIGTDDGLNRYDAYQFRVWQHDPFDSTSINHNRIYDLFEDSSGVIWVGTVDGLSRYNPELSNFTQFRPETENVALTRGLIVEIAEGKDGNLWLATYGGGLAKFDPGQGTFTSYIHSAEDPGSIRQDYLMSLHVDPQGIVWAGLAGWGLERFDPSTGKFKNYHNPWEDFNRDFKSNAIRSIKEAGDGQLWIASEGGLNLFDKIQEKYLKQYANDPGNPQSIPSNFIYELASDKNNNFWITTAKGLAYFDPRRQLFTNWIANPDQPGALMDDDNFDLLIDGNGSLWLSTFSSGFLKTNLSPKPFTYFDDQLFNKISPVKNAIRDIIEDRQNRICLATSGGLAIYDREKGEVFELTPDPGDPAGLKDDQVIRVYQDSQGIYWLSTDDYGLARFDLTKNEVRHFLHDKDDPTTIGDNTAGGIIEDHLGNLWVATFGGGLNKMDREKGTFKPYKIDPDDSTSIGENRLTGVFIDSKKQLWTNSLYGLYRFNYEDESFTHFLQANIGEPGISHNYVLCLFEDSKYNLWVGTKGGLDKLDLSGVKQKNYAKKDGLPSNQIFSIIEDGLGFLWLGTSFGLSKFDPVNETFQNFDHRDGLPKFAFYTASALKDSNGQLHFGNREGMTSFFPDQIATNTSVPPIVITSFRVTEGAETDERWTSGTTSLELNHRENVFSFEFAALNFISSDRNSYAYMMEGFDPDWIHSGNRRFATYTNLDPGTYTFRVKGSNNDGLWNELGTSVNIIVHPPWWQTWWAYSIYFALFIGAISAAIYFILKQERLNASLKIEHERLEKLREVDEIKTRFFTNISHELRTPLTLILGPLQALLDKQNGGGNGELKMMHRNGQTLLRLINQLLDIQRLQSGKMKLRASRYDLIRFCRQTIASFESLASQKSINLAFQSDHDLLEIYFDKDQLGKILTNLLSNALKFTEGKGHVIMSVGMGNDFAIIAVKDTGIGIPEEAKLHIFDRFYQVDQTETRRYPGSGIGLALVRELVELHHGEISIESEEGKGSTFTIRLPAGTSHLRDDEVVDDSGGSIERVYGELSQAHFPEIQQPVEETESPLILVVEDNPDMRTYMRENLKGLYSVIEASDGKKGLEVAIGHIPELIVTDVMMPEMDGIEFCEKIKMDERTSHIPVVMLTAKASEENKLEGLETGVDAYLTKPFNPEELKVRIRKLIEQRAKLRQKFSKTLTAAPMDISVESSDEKFISKVLGVIEGHMADSSFDVVELGEEMGLSRVQLYRKIKALTNLTVSEFIRSIRLKRAAQLLEKNGGNISEISYQVGFSDPSYFSKRFKEQFGVNPRDFSPSGLAE